MGRPEENPIPPPSDQTTFQPPQGYPNHHDNPLSPSLPPQQPRDAYVDNSYNMKTNHQEFTTSHISHPTEQPALSQIYIPQPQPSTYPLQQPPETYPAQPQMSACPPQQSPVCNGTSYHPQSYNYTPTHNAQPQVVNCVANTGYQQQVTTGTPNWYQPSVAMTTQEWTTGLFDCFYDPENAIMTLCFPCVTFGQIAEILDNGQTLCATSGLIYSLIATFVGFPCIVSCSYRTKLRNRYNLLETPAPDWVIHLFCEYCAICQEYRELKNRGMDPALGWQGNLSKHQHTTNYATMTPPTNQRMMG